MLSESIPLYALYSLLFSDTGLSDGQISVLFALWSVVGLLAEVPAGAWADRFSRRAAMVVSGVLTGAGFALWGLFPGFTGFAAGFALWGLGGAFASGAVEALVYDGMLAHGCASDFGRVQGRIDAAGLLAQVPAAVAATLLFALGGYDLVTAASVLVCLAAAALATRVPETRPGPRTVVGGRETAGPGAEDDGRRADAEGDPEDPADADGEDPADTHTHTGAWRMVRGGARSAGTAGLAGAVAAVALIGSLDDLEEYFPLLALRWGTGTAVVPLLVLLIPLAGAVGAVLGGRLARTTGGSRRGPVLLLALGLLLLAGAGWWAEPAGIGLVAAFYLLYRSVTVILEVGMQHRITGPARATVGSIAEVGVALVGLGVFAAWAFGGLVAVLGLACVFTAVLPWLITPWADGGAPRDGRLER